MRLLKRMSWATLQREAARRRGEGLQQLKENLEISD